ncbi:MAG: DapH/DapD/GlmU-related protein [Candidatus Bruticola sp.]
MEQGLIHTSACIDVFASLGEGCRVGAMAVIESGAQIGCGAEIGPKVYIGRNVSIGERAVIKCGAVIMDGVVVGREAVVESGAVLGMDGFGYVFDGQSHRKIQQIGNVVIGQGAKIGACSCIDRAASASTVVGDHTEIGHMVMVGHNSKIGSGCRIGDQSGLTGSSLVGNDCIIGSQCGIGVRVELGDGCVLLDRATAMRKYEPGQVLAGHPGRPVAEVRRAEAAFNLLPKLLKDYIE